MAVDIKYHKKPSQTFDKKKLLISPKKFPLTFQLKPFFKKNCLHLHQSHLWFEFWVNVWLLQHAGVHYRNKQLFQSFS